MVRTSAGSTVGAIGGWVMGGVLQDMVKWVKNVVAVMENVNA
jgi:hypothetical protein